MKRLVINELKHRELNEEQSKIIIDYLAKKIEWIDAHNKLIPLGICLTKSGVLIDY